MKTDPKTLDVIKGIRDLKPLPKSHANVLRVVSDSDSTVDSLERAIMGDPALTARILRSANSAFFGLSRRVDCIRSAVNVLGYIRVRDLAGVLSLNPWLKELNAQNFDALKLWEHSLATALWAQELALKKNIRNTAPLFTAGLMHDLGIMAMVVVLKDPYLEVLKNSVGGVSLNQDELRLFGTTHARVGGALAQIWQLPEAICEWITMHHSGLGNPSQELRIIQLADEVSQRSGFPELQNEPHPAMPEALIKSLKWNVPQIEAMIKHTKGFMFDVSFLAQ